MSRFPRSIRRPALRLRRQLIELWQETGKTVVFVTHDVDEALFLADRIIVLSAKPARVVETVSVTTARPREIETDPRCVSSVVLLLELFGSLENKNVEDQQ